MRQRVEDLLPEGDVVKIKVADKDGNLRETDALPCDAGLCIAQGLSGMWAVVHFRSGSSLFQLIPSKKEAYDIALECAEAWSDWNTYPPIDVVAPLRDKYPEYTYFKEVAQGGHRHLRNVDRGEIFG